MTNRTSLDSSNPTEDALKDFNDALENVERLHQTHVQAWFQLWKGHVAIKSETQKPITVDGSPDAPSIKPTTLEKIEKAPLSAFYFLLSSLRVDWPHSVSSGSLSTNINNGHVTWDAELWMFPRTLFFSVTNILIFRKEALIF